LRDQCAGRGHHFLSEQRLEPNGIKLYDDRLELGSSDREARLIIAAREYADAPRPRDEILIATRGADAEAKLAFGDESDMRPMPSSDNVLSVAGIVLLQQEAGPRSSVTGQKRGFSRGYDLTADDPANSLPRLPRAGHERVCVEPPPSSVCPSIIELDYRL
jgi:hypothetical protein